MAFILVKNNAALQGSEQWFVPYYQHSASPELMFLNLITLLGAVGYAALYSINGLLKNDFSFAGSYLGIAAGVYLFGVLLHELYTYRHKLGKKYRLEMIKIDS